jgi:hypothetical protein
MLSSVFTKHYLNSCKASLITHIFSGEETKPHMPVLSVQGTVHIENIKTSKGLDKHSLVECLSTMCEDPGFDFQHHKKEKNI